MLSNRSTKKILTAIGGPVRTIYSASHPDEMHHWFEMHKQHTNGHEHGHVHGPLFDHGHGHHPHHGARHMHSETPHHHAHDPKPVSHTEEDPDKTVTYKAW